MNTLDTVTWINQEMVRFYQKLHIKKNTRDRFVTVEITLETAENVRNWRENSHSIDNRVPRIVHVRVDLFGRFVTEEKNRVCHRNRVWVM